MIVFVIFYFCLWFLYFFNFNETNDQLILLKDIVIEKDYNHIISLTAKDPEDFFIFRLIMGIFSCFIYSVYKFNEINLYNNIISLVIMIVVYKGLYFVEVSKYKKKLNVASKQFPYYLNNLSILINNNPVLNAIYDSIESAPLIFQKDLLELVEEVHQGEKDGITPYMEFYNKYKQIEDLHRIMITLYNMSQNNSDNEIIMASLCKLSNEKLNEANKQKLNTNLDKQALMPWLGFLWIGFAIISLLLNFDLSILGSIS
jgi:hypothetical protein